MEKTITFEKALNRVASWCSAQERSILEVRNYLEKLDSDPEDIEKILIRLVDENFVDEKRFALAFTRDKFRFNKWGKVKIRMGLREKGINSEIIQISLDELDDDEYLNLALSLLKEKARSVKSSNEYDRKGKLARFLMQKGFESELVMRIVSIQADNQNL